MSPEEKAIEKTIIQLNAEISKKQQEIKNESQKTVEMTRLLKEMKDMEEAKNRVKHPNNYYVNTITMTSKEKTIEMQRNSDLSNKKQKLENELNKLLDKIATTQFEIELHLLKMEEANRVKVNLNKKKDRYAKWKSEAEAQKVILEKQRIAKKNQEALKQMKQKTAPATQSSININFEKIAGPRAPQEVFSFGGYRSKNLHSHSKSKSKKKHLHSKSKSKRKSKH